MKVLIVEDKPALMEMYFRIFGKMLEGTDIEFDQVSTISETLPLLEKEYGVILMDSELGEPALYSIGAEEELKISNGYDLVKLRRRREEETGMKRSVIFGITTNHVAATFMVDSGASNSLLKTEIPQIAKSIKAIALQEKKQ